MSLIAAKNVVTPALMWAVSAAARRWGSLIEDFRAGGGMGALLHELRPLLHVNTMDGEGRTLVERLDEPTGWVDREVMRALNDPVSPVGGLVTLEGNLACESAPNHTQSHTSGRSTFKGAGQREAVLPRQPLNSESVRR